MRSERVFGALKQVPNRFLLTKLAAKATRRFHRPNTRIQGTMDDVLLRFSQACPVAKPEQRDCVQLFRRNQRAEARSLDGRGRKAAA